MSIKLPEVNINGELVNIRDIKKVVELLTKPSKAKKDSHEPAPIR